MTGTRQPNKAPAFESESLAGPLRILRDVCARALRLRLPVKLWRLLKTPLKSAGKARSVSVAYGGSDLLDAHIRMQQEVGGLQESSFNNQMSKPESGSLLKQVLKAGLTQIALDGQTINFAGWIRFDDLQDSAQPIVFYGRNERAYTGVVVPARAIPGNWAPSL
ncbi:MAG: hypothetical protein WBX38_07780 [Candidatus Sulfotelmatobacter sp.]